MSDNYYDSLVDCALVIGVNEHSGLKPSRPGNLNFSLTSDTTFQQHILAAISSTVAIFPFSKYNHEYPPSEFRIPIKRDDGRPTYNRQFSKNELHIIHDLVNHYNKTPLSEQFQSPDIALSISRRNSKYKSRRKSIKAITLDNYKGCLGSVSIETINAFPGTYFNNNLRVSEATSNPKIEILPLTDNLGNRSYAYRLEFFRNMEIEILKNEDDDWQEIKLEPIFETDLDSTKYIFIPCNIVFFSKYPYFDLFKDILSQLFLKVNNKSTKFIEQEVLEYSAILTRIPIMKFENLQINFSIEKSTYKIRPNNSTFMQIVDWDMSLLFQTFSTEDIIFIICAMFQEQKIAFFSKYPNFITIICETLMVLFQPFVWKYVYLTVLPSHLYELVDAISPFIIGFPHHLKEKVIISYDDIMIIDIDEGSIHTPKNCQIVQISDSLVKDLKNRLKNRDWLMFRENLSTINAQSLEEKRDLEYLKKRTFSENVMKNFMIIMVELFQEILLNITVEKKNNKLTVANLDKFLTNSPSDNIQFFKSIYRNDNFSCFLENKCQKTESDAWIKICDKLYPDLLDHFRYRTSRNYKLKTKRISILNENVQLEQNKPCEVISFPTSKMEREDYFSTLLTRIGRLTNVQDMKKMEIEINFQMGNKIKALEIISELFSINQEAFDIPKIKGIIEGLSKNVRREYEGMAFSQILNSKIKIDGRKDSVDSVTTKSQVHQFIIPNIPIPRNRIFEICKEADISDFESIADDLFKCLTLDHKSGKSNIRLIAPNLFQCFYNNWIQAGPNFNETDINVNEIFEAEFIIVTKPIVKVENFGQGRIILTQMRLLFIPFGKTSVQSIIDFTSESIFKIKIDRRIRGFGKLSEVLEIIKTNSNKKIVIWLSEDIEIWFNLISEVNFGNRLSIEEKDKIILEKMTEQCLVYENLVMCSKINSYFKKNLHTISKIMLSFMNSMGENMRKSMPNVSMVHRKYLIVKMMPSPKHTVSIDYVLPMGNEDMKRINLWCALSIEDKYFIKIIQVFDKNLQVLHPEQIELTSKVKLMICLKEQNKIVCGCYNGTLCIIDVETFTIQEINIYKDNSNYALCGVPHYDESNCITVYLGSSNGEVTLCDPDFSKVRDILTLPNKALINFIELKDSTTLLLGSSHQIYLINTQGEILSVIEITSCSTISNRLSFMGLNNDSNTLFLGQARLPALIEYDITDSRNPICLRRKNLTNNQDIMIDDFSDQEMTSRYVGVCSILNVSGQKNEKRIWVIYKGGLVEIRNSKTLEKVDVFNAHTGQMNIIAMPCTLNDENVILTVGKDDGKIILWKPMSLKG